MSVDLRPVRVERENLVDPGFEIWTSGSVLTYWTPSSNLTMAQEATTKRTGSFSAKATRTDDLFGSLVADPANLPRLAWYYVAAWAQATAAVSQNLRIRFVNSRTGYSWDAATRTWITGAGGSIYGDAPVSGFVKAASWVPLNAENSLDSDAYQFQLAGYFGNGNSLYYDDATVFGPFARPVPSVALDTLTRSWRTRPGVSFS